MELSDSVRRIAGGYLKTSRADLKSAKDLRENRDHYAAVFYSQQSAEKALCAVLALEDIIVRNHEPSVSFVSFIMPKAPEPWEKELRKIVDLSQKLEREAIRSRYPNWHGKENWTPSEQYERADADLAISKGDYVLKTIEKYLKEVYKFEI